MTHRTNALQLAANYKEVMSEAQKCEKERRIIHLCKYFVNEMAEPRERDVAPL